MTHPVPSAVPATLRAGDTATWARHLADYSAADGWVLDYLLVNAAGQIAIASSADGSAHLVAIAPATTGAWAQGAYAWQERVSKDGQIHTTATGSLTIAASFAAATSGLDARSHAEKTLAAIELWIESGDLSVADYTIGDKALKRISIPDLLKLRDRYRREVRRPTGKSTRIYTSF